MRIAQITDLHLRHHQPGTSAQPGRRSREMLRLFARALKAVKQQNVDLLAITGDLLDVPLWLDHPVPGFQQDDPDFWQAAVEADYRELKTLLDATGIPYIVLPGNHDSDAIMWRVFDPEDNAREIAGRRVVRFCDHEHDAHFPRRFHPQRTRWLQELARADGPPQVHLQHYLINPVHHQGYPHSYAEADAIRDAIVQSGRVQLCLSGHYHAGTDLIHDGPTCFATGPAFCQPPFPWRIYQLDDNHISREAHTLGQAAQPRRPVVFLDRDGVINDRGSYHHGPEEMRLLPNAAHAIKRLRDAGYAIVVVTNQTCIGSGYVPHEVVYAVNDRMCRLLAQEADAEIDAIYLATGAGDAAVLPHLRDNACCKPSPALLHQAQQEVNLDFENSWMVGDCITDAHAAHAAGVQPVLVRTGRGADQETAFRDAFPNAPVTADLAEAAAHILRHAPQPA